MVYIRVHSWCLTAHAAVGFVSQSTLCNPVGCSPPGSSVHGDSPGKNTGVSLHALLQEIFPTQGLSPHLSHLQWILYHLSHQGSPLHPISLDKFIVTCIYHYRFKQNGLTAMKPLCSAYSCVPPTWPLADHWFFAFFRISYSWNHTVCNVFFHLAICT